MRNHRLHRLPKPITQIIVCFLAISFLSQNCIYSAYGQLGPINLAPTHFNPAVLRYLSVNSSNPFNYFNFLLDRGDSRLATTKLNTQAKQLINYFFLGITLPDNAFWVNLRPDEPGRITSEELSLTDMGKALLEQDLQLKRDMARYLHPSNTKGKEFWEKLYATIGKDKVKKAEITTSNRVWIVPDEAVVMETEDGAFVASAKLKVMLENEYFDAKKGLSPKGTDPKTTQIISEQLMEEIILPAITQDVNTSPTYAPLRQIYNSLILAQWFKRKHKNSNSVYSFCIDKGYLKGLESQLPWSKQAIWQEYLESYQNGEYKLKEKLAGLNRMYWSGGMDFTFRGGDGSGVPGGSSPLRIIAPTPDLLNKARTGRDALVSLGTSPVIEDRISSSAIQTTPIGPERKEEPVPVQEETKFASLTVEKDKKGGTTPSLRRRLLALFAIPFTAITIFTTPVGKVPVVHGNEMQKTIEIREAGGEIVRHTAGSEWRLVPGNPYAPSGKNSLFQTMNNAKGGATGGFANELTPQDITYSLGTFTEQVDAQDIENLLQQYQGKIQPDQRLLDALREIIKDKGIFNAFQEFFRDGGSIEVFSGTGHYDPITRVISIGMDDKDELGRQKTAFHEGLHFVNDKKDSALWESKDTGGADHFLISPLEERFLIIQLIQGGRLPLDKRINPLYGETTWGKLGEKIEALLKQGDLKGLESLLTSEEAYLNYVHSGMVEPLSDVKYTTSVRYFSLELSNDQSLIFTEDKKRASPDSVEIVNYKGRNKYIGDIKLAEYIKVDTKDIKEFAVDKLFATGEIPKEDEQKVKDFIEAHRQDPHKSRGYILTPEQIQDLANLYAYNANILFSSLRLAIVLAQQSGKTLEKVYQTPEYKGLFLKFLREFSLRLQNDPQLNLRQTTNNIVNDLLKSASSPMQEKEPTASSALEQDWLKKQGAKLEELNGKITILVNKIDQVSARLKYIKEVAKWRSEPLSPNLSEKQLKKDVKKKRAMLKYLDRGEGIIDKLSKELADIREEVKQLETYGFNRLLPYYLTASILNNLKTIKEQKSTIRSMFSKIYDKKSELYSLKQETYPEHNKTWGQHYLKDKLRDSQGSLIALKKEEKRIEIEDTYSKKMNRLIRDAERLKDDLSLGSLQYKSLSAQGIGPESFIQHTQNLERIFSSIKNLEENVISIRIPGIRQEYKQVVTVRPYEELKKDLQEIRNHFKEYALLLLQDISQKRHSIYESLSGKDVFALLRAQLNFINFINKTSTKLTELTKQEIILSLADFIKSNESITFSPEEARYIEERLIERLLFRVSGYHESIILGYALLKFRSTEALLLNILNAFREKGGSGEQPFLYVGSLGSNTELYKLINSLTEQEKEALKSLQVPKLEDLIDLISENLDDLNYQSPKRNQMEEYFAEIALHFLRQGNPKMELFILDLVGELTHFSQESAKALYPYLVEAITPHKYVNSENKYLYTKISRALKEIVTLEGADKIFNLLEIFESNKLSKEAAAALEQEITRYVDRIRRDPDYYRFNVKIIFTDLIERSHHNNPYIKNVVLSFLDDFWPLFLEETDLLLDIKNHPELSQPLMKLLTQSPGHLSKNLKTILGVFNQEIVPYLEEISTGLTLLDNPSFLVNPLLEGSMNETIKKATGNILEVIKLQHELWSSLIDYLSEKPAIFFANFKPILVILNPDISLYAEEIKTTFSALGNPPFLVKPILNGTLNDTLINTSGNLLEAIKSQSQLTDNFSVYLIHNPELFFENLEAILQVFNPDISLYAEEIKNIFSLLDRPHFLINLILDGTSFSVEQVRDIISLPKIVPQLFTLINKGGILYSDRTSIIEDIFANGDFIKRAKEIESIFTTSKPPWEHKYFYTEMRFGKELDNAASGYPITEIEGVSLKILARGQEMPTRLKAVINNSDVLAQVISGKIDYIPFSAMAPEYKRLVYKEYLRKSIQESRSIEAKIRADERNRMWAKNNLNLESGMYIHGSPIDVIESVLLNGNLPGESLGERFSSDSYPFHVDFTRLDAQFIKEKKNIENIITESLSGGYGTSGKLGGDGQMWYVYRRLSGSWEEGKEYGSAPKDYHHALVLGGMPATEISAIILRDSNKTLEIAKKAIVENGFYTPIYDLNGKLLFATDEYDDIYENLNLSIPVKVWEYSLKTGPQKGSNPGAEFTVPTEEGPVKYYVKFASSENNANIWNEYIADEIYRLLEIPTPETEIVKVEGVYGHASRILPIESTNFEIAKQQLKNGFLADALMANWDVPYAVERNTVISNGKIYRIDNGGALLFRARGERKKDDLFGPDAPVRELEIGSNIEKLGLGMRQVYEGLGLTEKDIMNQVVILKARLTDRAIEQLVDSARLSKQDRDYLKATLKHRRDYILSWANTNFGGNKDMAASSSLAVQKDQSASSAVGQEKKDNQVASPLILEDDLAISSTEDITKEEIEFKFNTVSKRLSENINERNIDNILKYYYITRLFYANGSELRANPGLLTAEHIFNFVRIMKDLPGANNIAFNFWRHSSYGQHWNSILDEFYSVYTSIYNNRGPYYLMEDVPAIAGLVMDYLVNQEEMKNMLIETDDDHLRNFNRPSLLINLNVDHPIRIVKLESGKYSLLENVPSSMQNRNLNIIEFASKENPDKRGRDQYRAREVIYYKNRPDSISKPIKTEEGFYKADWPESPSIWTAKLRESLREIAVMLKQKGYDFIFVSEGGAYKGTMIDRTDLDTYLYIKGEQEESLEGAIQNTFSKILEKNRLHQKEKLRIKFVDKSATQISFEIRGYERGIFITTPNNQILRPKQKGLVVEEVVIPFEEYSGLDIIKEGQSAASPLVLAPKEDSVKNGDALSNPTYAVGPDEGGIDLSQIEITLKDEKFVSSLNPADLKVLRAAKALKDGWESLSLLYVHEIMLLLKDNLIQDIQNRGLLLDILRQLQTQDFLDPQAINFLNFLHSQRPISEIKVALY